MSADFWSGYVSGAIGILVGNPLDIIKTKLQAGGGGTPPPRDIPSSSTNIPGGASSSTRTPAVAPSSKYTSLARGAAAPILGYGALNALLFVTYNRSLAFLDGNPNTQGNPPHVPSAINIFAAGALGGLATFFVSAPTELIKCRAQVSTNPPRSSLQIARDLWAAGGIRGLYMGGAVTSVRDAVGYGFYFWSYELSKRALSSESDTANQEALKVLLCGGLAGVVTWVSIFPLDVLKTRVQTWDLISSHMEKAAPVHDARQRLLQQGPISGSNPSSTTPIQLNTSTAILNRPSTLQIAMQAYRIEGPTVFFRGLGICSARAFIVNAFQWAIYEWMMRVLTR